MSYILEALQKSEHARHRGKVPDLNTLPETTPSATGHAATPRPPYLAAGFALALAAAILGWWRPWQVSEPQPAATPQQASQNVQAEAARTLALAAPAAPQPAPPPAPLAAAAPPALEPLAPTYPPAAAPEPAKTAVPVSKTRPEPSTPELPAQAATRIAAATPAAPAPAANRKRPDGRILSIHELPPAVRGSLPRLDISGFAAAPDSGKRMVVINDRLVQEGEEVVPGVTLTSAEKDGVVLDFQGYRFRAQQ